MRVPVRSSSVYFALSDKKVKIGISTEPPGRIKEMKVRTWKPTEVISLFERTSKRKRAEL
jgi:hypothetical protein